MYKVVKTYLCLVVGKKLLKVCVQNILLVLFMFGFIGCQDIDSGPDIFNPLKVFSPAVYEQIGNVNATDLDAVLFVAHHEKMDIHNPKYKDDEGNINYAETIVVFNEQGFASNREGIYCLNKVLKRDNDWSPKRNTYKWEDNSRPMPRQEVTWSYADRAEAINVKEQLPDSFGYIRFSDTKLTKKGGVLTWQNYDMSNVRKVSILGHLGKKNGFFYGKELKTITDNGRAEITEQDLNSLKFDTNTIYVMFTLLRANGKAQSYKLDVHKKILTVATTEKGLIVHTEQ